jgi:hypothetical protein
MPPMPIATSTISTSAMIFLFWRETTTTTLFQRHLGKNVSCVQMH